MINLNELFNLNFNKSQIVTIAGPANVGKSSIMTILTAELIKDGEKILYITEDNEEMVLRRFAKLLKGDDVQPNQAIVKQLGHSASVEEYLNTAFEINGRYDLVVIDSVIIHVGFDFLREFTTKHNCIMVVGRHINYQTKEPSYNNLFDKAKNEILFNSDFVVSINKIKPEKPKRTFWQKIRDFFFFWETRPNPNTTLKILKSRRGKQGTHDIQIDFEKLKIK